MAQKVEVRLVDDLDGSVAHETVRFGLDGNPYEIDLSDGNASALRRFLKGFVDHARTPAAAVKPTTRTDTAVVQAMRLWAADNGYQLAARGRIPHAVVDAYFQAH